MSNADKISKAMNYLINVRYFATLMSNKTRKEINSIDINCSEAFYLTILSQNIKGLTMSELSALGKVDKSLITRVVKSLIEKEYIYKDTDKLTSRNYKIKLTDKGKGKAALITNILIEGYDNFINKLSNQEIKILDEAFSIIINKSEEGL